jgi:hypothetical protein
MIYVLKMDKENSLGIPRRVRLIGPFGKTTEASLWAHSVKNSSIDMPMWQIVDLSEPVMQLEAP